MAESSSLVLLPPRHTAQAEHSTTTKTKKASSDASFAPKLAQAKLTTAAKMVVKPPVAKAPVAAAVQMVVPKALVTKSTEVEPEKQSPGNAERQKQNVAAEDQPTSETTAAKAPVPSSGKQVAIAQASAPVEKKAVKPVKTVAVKAPSTAHPNPNNAANTADRPVDPAANSDDTDSDPLDDTVTMGSGFYGSTKIVARGGVGASGDQVQSAGEGAADAADDASTEAEASAATGVAADPEAADATEVAGSDPVSKAVTAPAAHTNTTAALNALTAPSSTAPAAIAGRAAVVVTASPQVSFNEVNHPAIVSNIQGQLLPNGGTMSIRLDPKELGALQVTVHMKDGAMTASFTTSNDDATKLLSRSLGQLKSGLEAAGMNVQKLHVEQGSKQDFQKGSDSESKQAPSDQQQQAQRDQQRRELMQRMLRKISGGGDPLDMVA